MEKAIFFKLLDKYIAGKATLEEEQQLLNFYGSFNQEESERDMKLDISSLDDKILNRVMESLELEVPNSKNRVYTWKKFSIAAVLLLTTTTAAFFYTNNSQSPTEEFVEIGVKNDIAPGNNKAILTLADGSKISLDDAATGFVASQGNTSITKTEDGQIVYKKNEQGLGSMSGRLAANTVNTIQTPKGGRYTISLPDGSKVWLNSASRLSYPTAFTGSERKVKLIGEAYFEIAKNKKVPFRVESNNQIVEVLGTHFNINSYENEAYIKTTLLEGSVRIILNSAKSSFSDTELLKPGEQSLTNSLQSTIRVENTDTEKAVAWKNGYFKFKNTPIEEIMREIERWYDVELVYDGKMPADELTGFISNQVKISSVLNILEQSGGIKFTVKGRKIKIKSVP